MAKTNKSRFFNLLGKASQPVKTSNFWWICQSYGAARVFKDLIK